MTSHLIFILMRNKRSDTKNVFIAW